MKRSTPRWLLAATLLLVLAGCAPTPAVPTAPASVGAVREPPPSPTPTDAPSPADLAFASIPNPFERRLLAPGMPIAQAGLYFMDVATGEVEAWALPSADHASFSASPDNRWVIGSTASAHYLADRRSGAAYRWQRESLALLAAQGEHLLFLAEGQVWLAGPGQPVPVALPIAAPEAQAVIAPDAQTAAILSGRTLYRVRLADAACRAVAEVAAPPEGASQSLRLQAPRRGESLVLTINLTTGTGAARTTLQRVERYSWQGERLGELTLPGPGRWALSPDGRLVAWEERLSHLTQAVVVADAATLAPRFRVVGASLCFYDLGSGDWLADSSALIVRTSEGYRIVTAGGKILAMPTLAGEPAQQPDEPLPAPDRADLFAIGRRMVLDAAGRPLATAPLPADPNIGRPADLLPWGLDSRELRFALPHLGHGGRCGEDEYLLPARMEPAPFGPLVLAVGLPAHDCVNLRAAPGSSAQLLACLPGDTRLSPAPLAEPRQAEGEVYYLTQGIAWADEATWLRVRAPDGQEGWVDAEAGKVGWAP